MGASTFGVATFLGAGTFFAVGAFFAAGSFFAAGAFGATAAFSDADFLPDSRDTTAFGAVSLCAVAFLTTTDPAAGLAAGAFAGAVLLAGLDTFSAADAADKASFRSADFFVDLWAVDTFFAGSTAWEPNASTRLRGGCARRTSAATVSSRG